MIIIDYRKLIGFSKGSYVVTMPKSWITKHRLKKGDVLGIEEGNNEIIFYANNQEPKKEEKSISIEIRGKKLAMIKAEIVSAYLNNFNIIEILSNNLSDDAPVIKGIIRNLSGMEIIEQTSTRIVAKDLIDVGSISIHEILRRMDIIARSMIDDTILCMEGKSNPASIVHRDIDVNRLYYLGSRAIKNAMENPALMSKFELGAWQAANLRSLLVRIEEIADVQKRISMRVINSEFDDKLLSGMKEISEEIRNSYLSVMKAFYTNDKKIAMDIEVSHKYLIEKCNKFLENASKRLSVEIKGSKQPQILSRKNMAPIANIVEFEKSALGYIRRIARVVLSIG